MEEEVEIQSARRVLEAALPAMLLFDPLKLTQKLERLQGGFERGDRVDELRLVAETYGGGAVEGGGFEKLRARQTAELGEGAFHLRDGILQVRADADVGEAHALSGAAAAAGGFLRRRRRRLRGPVSGRSIALRASGSALWKPRHHAS